MTMLLSNISIVLVEPTHPGNIGAVARAMKTMGLSKLCLINPKKFPHYEATKRAASADDVLDNALVFDQLEMAIEDCTLVFGTSVRDREVTWPTLDPRQTAEKIAEHLMQSTANDQTAHQVAVLFGRESSGLTNAELDLCQQQIRIPANPEYSSLNLASAVQIIAYELNMISQTQTINRTQSSAEQLTGNQLRQAIASRQQQEGHLQHLLTIIEQLDFVRNESSTTLMRKLTRLYNKAELTIEEIQILRGLLTAIQNQLARSENKQ